MQFSSAVSVAAAAANLTSTLTQTSETTTLVTVTSCEDHRCVETTSNAIVTVTTATIDNTITSYTTWCPISSSKAATTANKTEEATPKPHETTEKATPAPTLPSSPINKNGTNNGSELPKSNTVIFDNGVNKALPAAGALIAGVAALLM